MAAELQPYPAYKDSGVEWLGRVPAHWDIKRGKTLFRCIDVRSSTGAEELLTVSSERGIVPRSSTAVTMFKAESYVGYKLCWPGDLVINSLWAWGRGLGVSRYHGIVSSAYGVYRLRSSYSDYSAYINELVRSIPFNWELQVRSKGIWISRLQLTDEAFLSAPFPLPPADEQAAIVRFLDHANRRIRRYIRAKEELIVLLEEQKQTVIQEAVTGRIDVRTGRPYPAYQGSRVGWSREVPEHWDDLCLGAAAESIQTGPFGSQLHAGDYVRGEIPVINPSHLIRGEIRPDWSVTIPRRKATELSRHELRTHDIVMARRGEVGRCALVTDVETGWVCGTGSLRVRPRASTFVPKYLVQLLSAPLIKDVLNRTSIGATMDNLNPGIVSRLRLPRPPLLQQVAIVEYLSQTTVATGKARNAVRLQTSALEIYRARLIADVVTGKLDVRQAATGLPELDRFAAEEAPDDDFNLHPDSEGSGLAEEDGAAADVVDAERSEAAAQDLISEGE